MARVRHPQFTWWPYRTLALAIPLLAFGAAVGAALNSTLTGQQKTLEVLVIFFAVLGAGCGYLFALSIGDLGKTVLAVPAGSIAGYVAVQLFSYPIASMFYLVLLGFLTIHAMLNGVYRFRVGCGGLLLIFLAGCTVFSARRVFEPELSAICAYPFLCGVVAAFMPYDRSIGGIRSAWLAGTLNATYGIILAWGIGAAMFIVVMFVATSRTFGVYADAIVIAWLVVAMSLANMFCTKNLFYSVYRVSNEPELPPVTKDETPTEAPKTDAPSQE